jgi:hypothetical protein
VQPDCNNENPFGSKILQRLLDLVQLQCVRDVLQNPVFVGPSRCFTNTSLRPPPARLRRARTGRIQLSFNPLPIPIGQCNLRLYIVTTGQSNANIPIS